MTTPSYITTADLVDAISESTYMALFDDTSSGLRATVDASTQVASVLGRSWSWIESWIPAIYLKMPPSTGAAGVPTGGDSIPRLLKDAQLQYATLLSYRRRPEYTKTYGAEPGGKLADEIRETMERVQAGAQRISPADSPPETTPGNASGFSRADGARIAITNVDGSSNLGDW